MAQFSNSSVMTARQFEQFIRCIPNNISVLVRSDHALGKSSIINQFAQEKKYDYVDCRLGQMDVGDILGLPTEQNGKTVYSIPDLLYPAFDHPCVLNFDELNRGTKDIQQSAFQMILDRRHHSKLLHADTYVFACINHDLDKYIVTEIDPALLTRFAVVDLKPTVPEWLDWGERSGKLCSEVLYILNINNSLADANDPNIVLTDPHPNRRGWTLFSAFMEKSRGKISDDELIRSLAAFVGKKHSEAFRQQLADYRRHANLDSHDLKTKSNDILCTNVMVNFVQADNWDESKTIKFISSLDIDQKNELCKTIVDFHKGYTRSSSRMKRLFSTFQKSMPKEIFANMFKALPIGLRNGMPNIQVS